jgi:hypothetical protein
MGIAQNRNLDPKPSLSTGTGVVRVRTGHKVTTWTGHIGDTFVAPEPPVSPTLAFEGSPESPVSPHPCLRRL